MCSDGKRSLREDINFPKYWKTDHQRDRAQKRAPRSVKILPAVRPGTDVAGWQQQVWQGIPSLSPHQANNPPFNGSIICFLFSSTTHTSYLSTVGSYPYYLFQDRIQLISASFINFRNNSFHHINYTLIDSDLIEWVHFQKQKNYTWLGIE